jgi:hypothetical protein
MQMRWGVSEHLQQFCIFDLAILVVCQVPKQYGKLKNSPSPSVWQIKLGKSKKGGPQTNFFTGHVCFPREFHLLRAKEAAAARIYIWRHVLLFV